MPKNWCLSNTGALMVHFSPFDLLKTFIPPPPLPSQLYPLEVLRTTNYRLPKDVDRSHLEVSIQTPERFETGRKERRFHWWIFSLKPHVRYQRVYGMGTSGFMLIPVTHPTQCVAECTKCGFSGKANTAWGPSPTSPQSKMAVRLTSEHMYAQNARARIRAMHVIGLLHTEVVWHTSQSLHASWCSLTHPHRYWRTLWWLAVRWRLNVGYGPMRSVPLLTYGNGEFTRTQISLRNVLRTAFACRHLRLKYVYRCQACEALIFLFLSLQYHLSNEDFYRAFGMTFEDFQVMPRWKQAAFKKQALLFWSYTFR